MVVLARLITPSAMHVIERDERGQNWLRHYARDVEGDNPLREESAGEWLQTAHSCKSVVWAYAGCDEGQLPDRGRRT